MRTRDLLEPSAEIVATDGTLVMAIPAFAPAIVVVAVVLWIARRDRQTEAAETDADD